METQIAMAILGVWLVLGAGGLLIFLGDRINAKVEPRRRAKVLRVARQLEAERTTRRTTARLGY